MHDSSSGEAKLVSSPVRPEIRAPDLPARKAAFKVDQHFVESCVFSTAAGKAVPKNTPLAEGWSRCRP